MEEPQLNDLQEEVLSGLKGFVTILLMLVLSVGFLGSGMLKLTSFPEIVDAFAKWGLPAWFRFVVGAFELVLAILIFYKPTRSLGCLITIGFMLCAAGVHLYHGELGRLLATTSLALVAAAVYFINREE